MRLGSHVDVRGQRSERVFREVYGDQIAEQRQRAIDALPSKDWRGPNNDRPPVRVYRVWCLGGFGKQRDGHEQFVPISVLWQLISFTEYLCPFHRP